MKKKQFLVACMPAVITLLIIVMNVLAENKVAALYKKASDALAAQDYAATETYLSQIEAIAPEYVPQYALSAECYLRMSESNLQLAYQELTHGIQATGSKYLISMAERLIHGDTDLVETTGTAGLPQTGPEDWSAGLSQPATTQPDGTDIQYTTMNYDFIVRYPDSQMEDTIQLMAADDSNTGNWTWTSSNPAVATVDENGIVHCGNQEGEAKITAQNSSYETAECWVCIIEPGIYSNDGLGADSYSYYGSGSNYYYIPEGNLSLNVGNKGMDAALASTKTNSVMEFLPRNSVSGDGLVGTSSLAYTPSSGASAADMVDENGFPIYQTDPSAPDGTESSQPGETDGGAISLDLSWQSLYFSGEYRIPEHLRFNGIEFTPTSVNFSAAYSSDITSLYLPASVTDIHTEYGNPFLNYTQLESITVEEGNPAYKTADGALLTADGTTLIAYPIASPETEFTIPEGVTTIASYAFTGNQNLTTLHIPASVTEFSPGALSNVPALKNITLDGGNSSFKMVDGVLTSADGTELLAAAVESMPENYTIPAQVTSVNEDLFRQNSQVKHLTIDASLGSLNLNDFTGLETLVVNGSVGFLSYGTEDSKLQDVTINGDVQSVNFYGGSDGMVITLNTPVKTLYAADFPVKLVHPENVTTSLSLCLNSDTSSALSPSLQDLTLDLDQQEVNDLQLLQSCSSLSALTLRNGTVNDLSALSALPLQRLELFAVDTQNLNPVWQCSQLTSLSIANTKSLTSVEGIEALQALTRVDLNTTQLKDVTPLAACTKLTIINLNNCDQVLDLSPLLNLPSLSNLSLHGIDVPDQITQTLLERGISTY